MRFVRLSSLLRWAFAGQVGLVCLLMLAHRPAPARGQEIGLTLDELRAGGYVIFFRHVRADQGQDAMSVVMEDCDTQRNIGEAGLREARMIGQAFRLLAIPVGTVWSSEFCRALETAHLAFGRAEPEPRLNLCCADPRPFQDFERTAHLRAMLGVMPAPGLNTVIVAHGVDVVADLEMGEAAIYRPDGNGGTERVARVRPTEWMLGVYPPGGSRPMPQ
jgi:hypothetical protein